MRRRKNSHVYLRSDSGSSVYQALWYDSDGNIIRRSTGCTDYKAAVAWLSEREREVHDPKARRSGPTVKAGVEAFLKSLVTKGNVAAGTRKMYCERSAYLVDMFGDEFLGTLTEERVTGYIFQRLEKEAASRNTVNKELLTLRRVLKHHRLPVTAIPEFRYRYLPIKRWITFEQFSALAMRLNDDRRLWVTLAVFTGARRGEVHRITWEDVDFTSKVIRLRGTKTAGSDRYVPLSAALEKVLTTIGPGKGHIVRPWENIVRDLEAACKRANIHRVTPNDLRRTYASWLKQKNVDSFTVAKLLGHSSSRMVEMVYGQLSQETFQKAASLLPGGDESE